ncbi:MAG: 2-oxo acid dehydrogenase subunit E2 [Bacillota bacterium]
MAYHVKRLSPFRLMSILGYEALGTGHNIHAQMEVDVTNIRRRLRWLSRDGPKVSFFGYLLSAIAKTIDENRELNLVRCGKKAYYFDEVDISTAIELRLDGVRVPRLFVLRNAAQKTAAEITAEIEKAKKSWWKSGHTGDDDRWAQRWIGLTAVLPGWLIKLAIRRFAKNPLKMKQRFGTTYVASVSGSAGDISGFMVPYFEGQHRPVAFAIGSITKKPGAVDGEVRVKEYLSLTVTFNHDLVDGAPAARFADRLRQRIEGEHAELSQAGGLPKFLRPSRSTTPVTPVTSSR